jgi:dienelactone hydrolase
VLLFDYNVDSIFAYLTGEYFMIKPLILIPFFLLSFNSSCTSKTVEKKFLAKASSAIVTKEVIYTVNNSKMKGFLALPEGTGPFPGVIVVHEWWGQTDYPRERARMLAKNGYAAFAVDMYGEGQTFDHPNDAKTFSSKVMGDLDFAEKNFKAALLKLQAEPIVNKDQIAAMGYCFGGAIVLEMFRRNLNLALVASYHGNLAPLVKNDILNSKTKVLIFNGAADPFVDKNDVETVRSKLKAANIRYKYFNYGGAKHAFTNPDATAIGEKYNLPLAYNARADEDSWKQTLEALKSVFKK